MFPVFDCSAERNIWIGRLERLRCHCQRPSSGTSSLWNHFNNVNQHRVTLSVRLKPQRNTGNIPVTQILSPLRNFCTLCNGRYVFCYCLLKERFCTHQHIDSVVHVHDRTQGHTVACGLSSEDVSSYRKHRANGVS